MKFLAYVVSPGKIRPDPERLDSFKNIKSPKSKEELRSVIGTLQYYSIFLKDFSAKTASLFEILKKNVRFQWTSQLEDLRSMISEIVHSMGLTMFDDEKDIFLTCDASMKGLGAVLSHDRDQKDLVWCSSRTLSPVERNYLNIESEALSIKSPTCYWSKYTHLHACSLSNHLV